MKNTYFRLFIILTCVITLSLALCSCNNSKSSRSVVVYTSVDQVYSEPILKEFEKKTGIKVDAVYDVEATKTVGLSNRLISEKNKPRADVFWNGEFTQTLLLKESGVLAPYKSSYAEDIPDAFKDKDNYWTGFGGRARVLLVNRNLLGTSQYPRSINDLADDKYKGSMIGLAYPLFGTTSSHAAALYAAWGDEKAKNFFLKLNEKGVVIADGNSAVKDLVASGKLAMGLVDTDDALEAVNKGKPVDVVFLDQGEGELGTLVSPNTVALISGAPHTDTGKEFIDFLLSREIEKNLIEKGWIDIPVRPVGSSKFLKDGQKLVLMKVNFNEVYGKLQKSRDDLQKIFIR